MTEKINEPLDLSQYGSTSNFHIMNSSQEYTQTCEYYQSIKHNDDKYNCTVFYEKCPDLTNETPVMISFLVYYSIIFILGIIGNFIIAWLTLKNKSLQTVQNIFILNLVISDIVVCIFSVPVTPITLIFKSWYFGNLMCHLMPLAQAAATFVSTLSLSAIAIDRYILVVRPHTTPITIKGARNIAIALWLFSILISSPYGYFMDIEKYPGFCGDYCDEKWSDDVKPIFTLTVFTAQFLIPCLTMAFCYICIFAKLKARTNVKLKKLTERSLLLDQMLGRNTNPDPPISSLEKKKNSCSGRERQISISAQNIDASSFTFFGKKNSHNSLLKDPESRQIVQLLQQQRRTTSVLTSMVLIFVFAWLPYSISTILMDFNVDIYRYEDSSHRYIELSYFVQLLTHGIAMIMNIANPILYAWLNPNFKNIFMAAIKRKKNSDNNDKSNFKIGNGNRGTVMAKNNNVCHL
uniref:G_PROTEIN_RECEP_F1_2 domain-containing protein n=1 Tax=Strongyloides papillosus TaxID=174720 RepID=A0A0N5B7L1_STREA